jgi:hypothetical protein
MSPGDDPVRFTFDQEGYLAHVYYESEGSRLLSLAYETPQSPRPDSPSANRILHHVHTHTTIWSKEPYAHVTLVHLLDHLGKKYVPNLEVIDKTGYWTSRDEKALEFRPLAAVAP